MKAFILILSISIGFWLSACKTTPEPSTPKPPQPESTETAQTRPPSSSEQQKTGQSGPQQQSKSSQKSGSESTEAPEQSTSQKAASSPAASTDAQDARPALTQKSEQPRPQASSAEASPESGQSEAEAPATQASRKSEMPRPQAPSTAESKLEKAREDLKVSEATERKIAAKLEELKKSGNAPAEDIRDYEIYHERVQAMVAENRKRVEELESAYRRHQPEGETAQTPETSGSPGSEESIPEAQTQDQVAELDHQLTASLSQFDAMLLKEMETIETKSAAKMRDLAQEAAEAAKRLKEKGIDLGTGESESSDEASQREKTGDKEAAGEKKDAETEAGDVDDAVASSDRPEGQGPGPKDNRGSRYNKEDDDIVARQLREAAENETDPELKEKLWKEYEDYRKNTQ
ncbi:MAG: hypothetical protein PVF71_12850 [Desulfobacterales bacterium]|jgi:hypothetical protein